MINLWSVTLPAGNILLSQTVFTCIKVLTLDTCICSRLLRSFVQRNLTTVLIWFGICHFFHLTFFSSCFLCFSLQFYYFFGPFGILEILCMCFALLYGVSPRESCQAPYPPGESADHCKDITWPAVLIILRGVSVWSQKMAHRLAKTFDINKLGFCDNTDSNITDVDI